MDTWVNFGLLKNWALGDLKKGTLIEICFYASFYIVSQLWAYPFS